MDSDDSSSEIVDQDWFLGLSICLALVPVSIISVLLYKRCNKDSVVNSVSSNAMFLSADNGVYKRFSSLSPMRSQAVKSFGMSSISTSRMDPSGAYAADSRPTTPASPVATATKGLNSPGGAGMKIVPYPDTPLSPHMPPKLLVPKPTPRCPSYI
ncbi:hypothetical protein CYMTET_20593 [Cymbomonas tetramitiformis]|uniref:Uncharacterized protein n=1 Tax=Cymbomonas tetramitiformis TaxID=36881 RepID=A0AAE0L407_9CHLO|nr:hypothetical protein CYMTET_20593 [Cymbomonas tetramitiformis]